MDSSDQAELQRLQARVQELLESNTKLVLENRALREELVARRWPSTTNRRADVMAFFGIAGQEIGSSPHVPSDEVIRLRCSLIAEEFLELIESVYSYREPYNSWFDYIKAKLFKLIERAPICLRVPRFIDALVDIDYVVEGARVAFGVDGGPIWDGVHKKNLEKQGGPRAPNGKLLKRPDFVPFDIEAELIRQGWQP